MAKLEGKLRLDKSAAKSVGCWQEIETMRTALAPAPTFTDAAGNNEKARALSAGEHQGQRTVVNY